MELVRAHPRNVDPELDLHVATALQPKFWVVACVSNPARYKTRYALYRQFRRHVLEDLRVGLVTVECALGDLDFQVTASRCEDARRTCTHGAHRNGVPFVDVRVRNDTWMWLKENLWNVGAQHLPHDCEYVMFCDADIRFDDPRVVHETIVALQTHGVVQPWYHCLDLGPKNEVLQVHQSFLSCYCQGLEWKPSKKRDGDGTEYYQRRDRRGIANLWHPGYCVAWRRSVLSQMQLLEVGVLGAGDHHMMGALVGECRMTLPSGIHPEYAAAVERWQRLADRVVRRNVGFVHATISHLWHGAKAKRRYVERWAILTDGDGFDPTRDVYKNTYGVLELDPERVGLRDAIRRYLSQRDEDSVDGDA